MAINRCKICLKPAKTGDSLCKEHKREYSFNKDIEGYKRKRLKNSSKQFHRHELCLVKILKKFYGTKNVIVGFHPLWAVSKKGALLEFDVYIPSKKLLIEYNGEQHYEFVPMFHKTKSKFLDQKRRDKLKLQQAKQKGLSLIIFKYNEPLFEDYVINKIQGVINGNQI